MMPQNTREATARVRWVDGDFVAAVASAGFGLSGEADTCNDVVFT